MEEKKEQQAEARVIDAYACSDDLRSALLDFLENEPLPLKKSGPLVAGLRQMAPIKVTVNVKQEEGKKG